MTIGNTMNDQTIGIPLSVGSRVTLLTDVEIEDDDSGSTGTILFDGRVEQYVPQTGKLSFEGKDIGQAGFLDLLEEADGIEILED